jgi:hypothetical protein
MARQTINIGTAANDGTGDPLRTAFDKINDNFIELYGADGDSNTLAGNLDINGWNIISSRSNEDIRILPAGTGGVIASAVRIAGTTISSDDSTQITIAENVQTTGTLNVSGAATLATSLTLATGATVTGILDEDNMASDSATQLATQQSIKAYVDSQVTAQDLDFQGDSGGALAVDLDSQTFTIAGGTGIDTAGSGQTLTVNIDSSVVTLTGSQTLSSKTLTSPTINGATITGSVVVDSITLADNKITTNASNANLELVASGTGSVELQSNTNITGTASVSGTLTTSDITTTGTHTVTGQSDIDYVRIKDNKITTNATNANLELAANNSGVIDVQSAMTTLGQTITGTVGITGQLDVDNISISGNGIIATNSNGGININPNGAGQVTIGGANVSVPSTFSASTVFADTQILLGSEAKIMPASTNADIVLETIGTGSVVLEEVSIRDNEITTHLSNADLKLNTDGTGLIDIRTPTQTTVGSAGGANALPATPTGYIKIKIGGTTRVIPFYDEA